MELSAHLKMPFFTRSIRLLLLSFFGLASLYYISRSYSRILPVRIPSPETSRTPPEQQGKVKAAFVTLIRNHELWDILSSIRQVEDRFNHNYNYPWVFMNEVPFTDEFIEMTSAIASGKTHYGTTLAGGSGG
jgi:alpha 1,2-mannosyltransferase